MPNIPDYFLRALEACEFICGSDECGLGAWAGNLTVCAVVTPKNWSFPGVTDSKKLSIAARERLYPTLKMLTHFIVQKEPDEIDQMGIGKVWERAHIEAIQGALNAHKSKGHLDTPLVIVDGNREVFGALTLPKADLLIQAVSAASIIAKVTRDHIMGEMDTVYPGFGFKKHVGYGTTGHRLALERLGVTPIHRKSYAPIIKMITSKTSDIMSSLEDLTELGQKF